jgi:hypothetical protein
MVISSCGSRGDEALTKPSLAFPDKRILPTDPVVFFELGFELIKIQTKLGPIILAYFQTKSER